MKLHCASGHEYRTESFQRQPHERNCPECGGRLETGMERNARKRASRNNGRLGRPKKTPSWFPEAERMKAEGGSYREIALALGVTRSQVEYQFTRDSRRPEKTVRLKCPDCGMEFERRAARPGTGKCHSCAHGYRPLRAVECAGCGTTFETRNPEKQYCKHRCYLDNFKPSPEQLAASAAVGRERKGKANPNFRHGRRMSEHERRLVREFNLGKKGEHVCRICAASDIMHAHHAVPRSLSGAGKYDLRNCLPLCARCHTSWHQRGLVIYRDVFTESEWEFIQTLINPGWLDERYPGRDRPFREEGMERVAA